MVCRDRWLQVPQGEASQGRWRQSLEVRRKLLVPQGETETHTSTIADGPATTQPAALCATVRLLSPLGRIICPSSVQAPSPGLGI